MQIVVEQEAAEKEVERYLDKRKVFPKQRERLTPAFDAVVEAMMFGYLTIDEEGVITQKLIEPIGDLTEIQYKFRVDPATINKAISALKVENLTNRLMVYIKSHSGLLEAIINKLENKDRNIADACAYFFQS
jgi:hypothetical protein